MPLSPEDLRHIVARTLGHYDEHAQSYWEGTRDHDVSQNVRALPWRPAWITALRPAGPGLRPRARPEDLHGAGAPRRRPGRFAASGRAGPHATVAAKCSSRTSWQLDLPDEQFDGVFANAVLFHVPSQELPRVLRQLHRALKPGGVLFSSNPRGTGQEGWNGDRYGAFHDWPTWQRYLTAAGFVEVEHFYRPAGVPIEQQPWLASVWRKPEASPMIQPAWG